MVDKGLVLMAGHAIAAETSLTGGLL